MSLVNSDTGEVVDGTTVLALRGEVSPVSLVLPSGLTFEEWEEYGSRLMRAAEGVMWWFGDWWRYGERAYGEAAAQAAPTGYGVETLRAAAWVAESIESVRRRTDLPWSHHREIAALEAPIADALLDKAAANGWSRDELRKAVRLWKTEQKIGRAAADAELMQARGVYQVLYVDPPWRYEHAEPTRAVENNYPTMTLDQIKALVVPAAPNSVMFMWATSPKLAEAIEVLEAWDFDYRTCMVWVKADEETGKQHIGMGYYARQQHELLLIAKRGDLPVPAESTRPSSVVVEPRGLHSKKPDRFYELIDGMYPGLAKVELFARNGREGWASWGNQAP